MVCSVTVSRVYQLHFVLCYGASCPLAHYFEGNSSYSFQWMILERSKIVTHGT